MIFGTKVRDSSISGTTNFKLNKNTLNIYVNIGTSSNKLELLDTFIHEIAIHADQNSADFLDDKKMNNSNAYSLLRNLNRKRGYTQHWQERNVNRAMEKIGLPILLKYCKSMGIIKTRKEILKFSYDFIN